MRMNQATVGMIDYAASVTFYKRLGLVLIVDAPPHYARFECPETDRGAPATFSLSRTDQIADTDYPLVYFETDTLDETVQRLADDGTEILKGPVDESWLWREADIRDPAGNRIRLYTAGANRRFPPWRIDGKTA